MVDLGVACGARTGLPTEAAVVVVTEDDGGACTLDRGVATTLASDPREPREVAVDAHNAYWADWGTVANHFSDGAIVQRPLCGGPSVVLATAQAEPIALAVDATHVYWANAGAADASADGAIMRTPIGGGDVETLASGLDTPDGIAVDATSVYWISQSAVLKVPIGGGTVTTLAGGQAPTGIAVDATSVYWSSGSDTVVLAKVPLEGGPVTTLLTPQDVGYQPIGGLAVDATRIYFGALSGAILATPLSGGSVTVLAQNQSSASGLVTDSSSLYWATGDGVGGDIMRLSMATNEVSTLVSQGGISIAVNEAIVAWTDLEGVGEDQGVVQIAPR
jgi:hypothetical protein